MFALFLDTIIGSYMRQLLIYTTILIALAMIPAKVEAYNGYFGSLPTTGKGFFYLCGGAKLTNVKIEGTTSKYVFKGTCTIVVKFIPLNIPFIVNDVPVIAKGSYDTVYARETVELANFSTIHSTRRCDKDPFRFGTSECRKSDNDPNNAISASPIGGLPTSFELLYPKDYPLMQKNASEQAIASASSALTEADPGVVDLSDWDPFAQGARSEPSALEIQTPSFYTTLPADTIYEVTVNKKTQSGQPANVLILFERLEEAPEKIGDIALPEDKTHWWVPQWSSSVAWRSLPFKIGPGRATKGLTTEGIYRVRVRVTKASGGYLGGWTGWRTFCVGGQEVCVNAKVLGQLGDTTQKFILQSMQKGRAIEKQ